ncbi:hypothetical protein [Streptomyces sp. NRRL F-5650]|uniref:hypothetical protein n=1 Tax=Streptomyces sp. NRRL F-5650 TaxID=1463868 RepID=UPI0006897AE0|nr:hypothetical protein [Streptomyces sp. NRRL F-5650]
MTIAALRRLLDEIDTQGGPNAARRRHLSLDDSPRQDTAAPQVESAPPAQAGLHAAIAELLRAGATYEEIRKELGGGSYRTISQVRRAEDIPVIPRPRASHTPEATYARYAEPYGDGHARWTGAWAGRMPQIQHPGPNGKGRKESALRVAFRMLYGREPTGYVRASCLESGCVAAGHLADREMRQELNRTRPRALPTAHPTPERSDPLDLSGAAS